MKNTHWRLVDGNSIGYAAHMANKLEYDGMEVQAIYGILMSLKKSIQDVPCRHIVLWDGASWRYGEYPEYKANRRESEVESKAQYKSQAAYIHEMLTHLGIDQVLHTTAEADDLAGYYVNKFCPNDINSKRITIDLVTGDKDWIQLVRPGVVWYDPIRNRECSLDNFQEFTGVKNAKQFIEKKAIVGDSSDNIKGVMGIGEKGADKLLASFNSVKTMVEIHETGSLGKVPVNWKRLADNEGHRLDVFNRNVRLMDLNQGVLGDGKVDITKGKVDIPAFRALCEELAFTSILDNMDVFVGTFLRSK